MSKDKQRVLDRSLGLSLGDMFDGQDFQQVKANLDAFEKRARYDRGEDVKFRVEYGYEYTDVYMDVYRDETDKEYASRLEGEAQARERARIAREKKKEKAREVLMATEAQEREEYLRLKAKFDIK